MRAILILGMIILVSCNGFRQVKEALKKKTPYEKYKNSLEKSDLKNSIMLRKWIESGEKALSDSSFIELPYEASGYFNAAEPSAHSYRFEVKQGQKLFVQVKARGEDSAVIFVDLFDLESGTPTQLNHSDSSNIIQQEFKENCTCLLRIQPELLAQFYYQLSLYTDPQLINPVSGARNKNIQSVFGDPRDGGKRSHEGIDIFAKRGTPVIAPSRGMVTRVGNTKLGGKTVWMKDAGRNLNYYFAHLETQLVSPGDVVKTGDTLGLVGNSGNARRTSPHLHFGIYKYRAIDPLWYVKEIDVRPMPIKIDTSILGTEYVSTRSVTNVRNGPGQTFDVAFELPKSTLLKITGETERWYRVDIPGYDRPQFVYKTLVQPAKKGDLKIAQSQLAIYNSPDSLSVPITHVQKNDSLFKMAINNGYDYVSTTNDVKGWIIRE